MKRRFPVYFNLFIILCTDALLLGLSWYSAYFLRFNFTIPENSIEQAIGFLPVVVIIKMIIFKFFDLYKGMWRYTSLKDLFNIIKGSVFSTLVVFATILFTQKFHWVSRSIIIIDCIFTIVLISSFRICLRVYFEKGMNGESKLKFFSQLFGFEKNEKNEKRLLIIGAGDSGEKLHREIRDNARLKYEVIAYLDDDYAKQGKRIHGVPVSGSIDELDSVINQLNIQEILIAVPSASSEQMRTIVARCEKSGLLFKILPGMGELIDGKITINAVREVVYRDLLGREVVHLEEDRIDEYLENSCILITGAGGSIGSELCRQICRFKPRTLVLFEQAESPLYDIDLELRKNFPYIKIVPVLGDIRNEQRLVRAFNMHKPMIVFHAAAYKHVPMLEIQPWEAILNNIVGTRNVVNVSKQFSVDRFVMVSTDKAVRPTNIMGATKRVSEMLVHCQNGHKQNKTRFITVRFGNVVGSVGSVVPLFKKQIEKGGPVTVTHPEVTRYFMTIPEASQLILQAGAMGKGGETFILEMGNSIKIADMARDLIRFSGFEPDVDIKIEYIGLRPGEKLYEELITDGEGIVPTDHKKIMVLSGQTCDHIQLNNEIDRITECAKNQDEEKIRTMLMKIVPDYVPTNNAN